MTALRSGSARLLGRHDVAGVVNVLRQNPVQNVFVASRIEAVGLDLERLGAEVWGHGPRGEDRLDALCWSGANLVPVGAGPDALRAFAELAAYRGRHCSSLVGPASEVLTLWELLEPAWEPARAVRLEQPFLEIRESPRIAADPAVRTVGPEELSLVLPACVAMFTEEVGVSPLAPDGGRTYRSRVAELLMRGRSFARIEHGEVVFKAELGSMSRDACQVQGVWVAPSMRGRGIGQAGVAAVVNLALRQVPVVSLYVNDFNHAARRCYEHVGFQRTGTFASVLF